MAKAVADALGVDVSAVQQVPYLAVDKAKDRTNALDNTAAGRMIFDYDPQGAGRRRPAWRIIWQNSQILADFWSM